MGVDEGSMECGSGLYGTAYVGVVAGGASSSRLWRRRQKNRRPARMASPTTPPTTPPTIAPVCDEEDEEAVGAGEEPDAKAPVPVLVAAILVDVDSPVFPPVGGDRRVTPVDADT